MELLVWVDWVIIRSLFASAWSFAILIHAVRRFLMHSVFAGVVVVAKTRSHLIVALSARVIFSVACCLTRLVNLGSLYSLAWPSFVVF
jgi:hypothetical protein